MSVLEQPPPTPSVQPRGEQRVLLPGIRWATYESLLADLVESSSPRLTYDRGILEVMSPLPEHEEYNRALQSLVETVAIEWGIQFRNLGSTTFRREDLEQGFEPDSCFYIQNEERVRGKDLIDLTVDPPPDLVIEIDITRSSLDKLSLYAQLRIPEIWRFDGRVLMIHVLEQGSYREHSHSLAIPALPISSLQEFASQIKSSQRMLWLRQVRDWARSQAGDAEPGS